MEAAQETRLGTRVFDFSAAGGLGRDRLGGKGYGLAEMTRIGLPVPPGFTITTDSCRDYMRQGGLPEGLMDEVEEALARLEARMGRRLGDDEDPLLVSVRSGAPISMPGMMDTILNLGLNDRSVEGLARRTGNPRFAYDSYRRLLQMFGNVVLGIRLELFEAELARARRQAGADSDQALDAEALRQLCATYRGVIREESGRLFPDDPKEQLRLAIVAVFESWNNPRARVYREVNGIPDDMGTAVNVQAMVFGNRGPTSGTGVLFTRDPNTGEPVLTGEYLANAQGEDVVAGIRTPLPMSALKEQDPALYAAVDQVAQRLEAHFGDVQDVEFTVEDGTLYVLQTRSATRSAQAAVRIAVDLVREGKLSRDDALRRVTPQDLEHLLHRTVDPEAEAVELAKGLPGSPGAATGRVVFDADRALEWAHRGEHVLLVRPETTPEDIHGIVAAEGVLTARGGMTSHAAIVARGMGKPAVVGCERIVVDVAGRRATVGERVIEEGDVLSIDGGTGRVFAGRVKLVEVNLSAEVATILEWADARRRLGVRANADTPEDAARARAFGAEGVGLCRTEHMFMAADRLPVVREMILAETEEERKAALDRLLPMQRADFEGILRAMEGRPVTIRLLDPPLHEFLPDVEALAVAVATAEAKGETDTPAYREQREVLRKARALAEKNPMLGFRGCRLGIVYPEIYAMQVRAILRAAFDLMAEGVAVAPEVMIPLTTDRDEMRRMRELVERVYAEESQRAGKTLPLPIGTMIEVPRACMLAEEIAEAADFFSFGTNDLTQTTYGLSRDDAEGKFLQSYLAEKIYPEDPFMVLDRHGVGGLMRLALAGGRKTRPQLKAGICGEHGGDPASIAFCHELGLDYVSASPYRVPIARLAAARAVLAEEGAAATAQD
jgi:pyruvate,orthophosphate dikinase